MSETSETFTDRRVEVKVVERIDGGVTYQDSWGHALPKEVLDQLTVGQDYLVETKGFNTVGGIATFVMAKWEGAETITTADLTGTIYIPVVTKWLYRNSDQDIERRHQEALQKIEDDRRTGLEKNREAWQRRQDALPKPLRLRLERFHLNGGEKFARDGWAYELVVCELAELYLQSEGEDSEVVNEYAEKHGTSGNQHGFAQSLAKLLKEKPEEVGKTISALTPITGDPDWKK